MIYITGDTHGEQDYGKIFNHRKMFKEEDILIIAGDFGGIWDGSGRIIRKYEMLKCKVAFVDGNHENFDRLAEYPTEDMWGGKVQRISSNIVHLMRGEVYCIDGNKILTMGGASSIDKEDRLEEDRKKNLKRKKYSNKRIVKTWWEQEVPNKEDIDKLYSSIEKVGYKVDYIITHAIDNRVVEYLELKDKEEEDKEFSKALEFMRHNVKYKKWYCGHYHKDVELVEEKVRVLFNDIIEIGR